MAIITTRKLTGILNAGGISTKSWGTGKAKRVKDLVTEINAGESHLRITRVTRVVKMIITDRDHPERGVLKETWQITSGGIRRERNQEPSGHIENESPEKALRRELEEELGLKVGDYDYHPGSVTIENQESRSFPGLPCSYEIHKFDVFPHPGTKVICDNFIETTEPDGTVSHFEWIPIPQVG